MIIESENDYLGALKGNHRGLLADVKTNFKPEQTFESLNKGHGRIEKRRVSICRDLTQIREWPGLKTLIQVESERAEILADMIVVTRETRYYSNPNNSPSGTVCSSTKSGTQSLSTIRMEKYGSSSTALFKILSSAHGCFYNEIAL
ncbi:hypothetical protein Xen7305DRAFT_00046390, partial [Xenococcus sp. PCC 7305]